MASHEQWGEVYTRLADLIAGHRTTLIFVNTRRLAERVAHQLSERLGKEHVASHHGSLSKERRLQLEERLKAGELRALVATASLELGIDIGSIDLVCQIGSPHSISTFLQRVGRSGHALGLTPRGKLFPTTRDELVECAALVRAVQAGRLDRVVPPVAPLEVLAQQIVAECACEDWSVEALYRLCLQAAPYRTLTRDDFEAVVGMLRDGVGEGGGRTTPLLHHDRINGMLRARRVARMRALMNGGVIPELGDFRVLAEPGGTFVGTVNEDWAIESMAGDIFLLGTTAWRIRRVEAGVVRVENANGAPPTIPFWLGEAPGRTAELSAEVGALRREVVARLERPDAARAFLESECGLDAAAATQVRDYLQVTQTSLGVMPSDRDVVFERFFDEAGDQHLVVHAPFGARINRAWGLALRKRFCVRFDFELQAAASDDAIVLSLGPTESFPLEEAFGYLRPESAQATLEQAILGAPMFTTRWRWNTTRALAVERQRAGKRVAPQIQRMRAEDLLAAVFPAQAGCQENAVRPVVIPDHPLVRQTVDDCLHEAMDIDGLIAMLQRIDAGAITLHARDTTEPSPMAHEILNGKPYTFLDDAPLEERRTRAVMTRHALPTDARDLAALDAEAIARVGQEAWPAPRDVEEAHDALQGLVAVRAELIAVWAEWLEALTTSGRAAVVSPTPEVRLWFAAENLPLVSLLFTDAPTTPLLSLPPGAANTVADREEARARLVRGQLEALGPVTASELAAGCGLSSQDVAYGLQQLEAAGTALRGQFTPGATHNDDEYCDRRLLARIHRYTLDRLRKEVDPVSAQDYMRFLLEWQHCTGEVRLRGKAGLRQAIRQLQGFEAPAAAWERDLLPQRVAEYHPSWLDELCLAGEVTWARLTPRRTPTNGEASNGTPSRMMPVTLALRGDFPALVAAVRITNDTEPALEQEPAGGAAREILALLRERGALFFDEIVQYTRRLPDDVESGLRDLVARGQVHADGFEGLRGLAGGRGGAASAAAVLRARRSVPGRRTGGTLGTSGGGAVGRRGGGADGPHGVDPAGTLRRDLPRSAHARKFVGAVARSAEGAAPDGSTRDGARRTFRGRVPGRAVRAAGSGGRPARDTTVGAARRADATERGRSVQPRGNHPAGREDCGAARRGSDADRWRGARYGGGAAALAAQVRRNGGSNNDSYSDREQFLTHHGHTVTDRVAAVQDAAAPTATAARRCADKVWRSVICTRASDVKAAATPRSTTRPRTTSRRGGRHRTRIRGC